MNIFFIYPSVNLEREVNYGLACLFGVIAERGHTVDLYQPVRFDREECAAAFSRKPYALCLVSSVTNQWPYALECIRAIKAIARIPVVVGGHHVSNCPEVLEQHEEIDAICLGEGDAALGLLLDRIAGGEPFDMVPNLWVRNRDQIIKNAVAALEENLDSLPFPDYAPFSPEAIARRPSMLLSRGCPYNCTYCSNNNMRKIYAGKGAWVRKKSVGRALAEVRSFIDLHHPAFLNFDDDTFIKDRAWLFEFLDGYRKMTTLPFDCNSRPETINDPVCAALKAANCRTLCIGIESGSESLRKRLYGRNMTNKTIIAAFRAARAHGLRTFAFNMVGAPGETFRDYLKTVLLNRRIKPDAFQLTIYYPFPGSELYARAKAAGLIDHSSYADNYMANSLLTMKQFPKWQIRYAMETFSVCVRPGENRGLLLYVKLLRMFLGRWLRAKGLRK